MVSFASKMVSLGSATQMDLGGIHVMIDVHM
jgi:hypothetical protein